MRRWARALLIAGGAILLLVVAGLAFARPPWDASDGTSPHLVTHDFVDTQNVTRVSKFRSGEGHDFSAGGESCRSMKHYYEYVGTKRDGQGFAPTTETQPVYAPFDGYVSDVRAEQFPIGKQVTLHPWADPAYDVRIFHMDPLPTLHTWQRVRSGELIGTLPVTRSNDVAVEVLTFHGTKYVSWFDVLDERSWEAYHARGVADRSDFRYTREYRDAHPYDCVPQGAFIPQRGEDPSAYVTLA